MHIYNFAIFSAHLCILIIEPDYVVTTDGVMINGKEIFITYFKGIKLIIKKMKQIMLTRINV